MSTGDNNSSTKPLKGRGSGLVPWRPGQSGNPSGRPKLDADVRDLAKAASPKAVATLISCLDSADDRVRIMAANSLLDRAIGKPVAALEVSGPDGAPLSGRGQRFDWSRLSADEFRAVRETLMKAAVEAPRVVIDAAPSESPEQS